MGATVFVWLCLVQAASTARLAQPVLGADVSYPQCAGSLPRPGAFAVVGVNKGLPFSANPCLGTGAGMSELLWAGIGAQLYANTADPGPALSSHWPNGQAVPQQCNTAAAPGADTPSCAYDYGWNAAEDSYRDAVGAYIALAWTPAGASRTPVANSWWLDVETANSWESNTANNVAELQGEVDYLKSAAAGSIGFYAPASNWLTITGGTSAFSSYPAWVPGASSESDAQARCSAPGVTGGPAALIQFSSDGSVADLYCTALPALIFARSSPTTVGVGKASRPMVVALPQPATAPTLVAFTTNSTGGSFSTSASGPWSPSLVVTVSAAAARTQPAFYKDTNSGTALIAATSVGDATATRSITVGKAAGCGSAEVDHGFEVALAHARTTAVAERLVARADAALRGSGRHATIERDGCTNYEPAVTGFRTRAGATDALRHLRRRFNAATIEKT